MSHWDQTYAARPEEALTWFEEVPRVSLDLIERAALPHGATAIDVGAGASRLAAHLLDMGYAHVTRLDLSGDGLAIAAIEDRSKVTDVVADVTQWAPPAQYDLWHDRAALHFLTDPEDQARYLDVLRAATHAGSVVILAGFASDGPEKCSGLPVVRRDPAALLALLGDDFEAVETRLHAHHTPKGNVQPFAYVLARRIR
ncbi:class I SAM-dependent methyltransferase [Anianabacter salinae]|uniref:class I SAM-dependent methyltransferase n=1 Tax=Anianabacter salinae TaxID=2851023 RepID=UPI00225DE931|nr:class I SAM-dependent methyltransferase [Anianabacter salinae]MBV0911501.1 class I SAM-dependent methyltransferase [Anianabacter salinae]